MIEKPRRLEWIQIAYRDGNGGPLWYLNGMVYTDLDEPLRLAKVRAEKIAKPMRIWIWLARRTVMLSTYRTSAEWGKPCTDKQPLATIWPTFETYARML